MFFSGHGEISCNLPKNRNNNQRFTMKILGTSLYFTVVLFIGLTVATFAQSTWSTKSVDGFTPRTYPCAAVVDGKIYVIGGYVTVGVPGTVDAVEVYNPANDTWQTPTTTGTYTPRGGASASVVGSKIYVIGGQDNSGTAVNTVEVFDTKTNTWSKPTVAGAFTARHRHVAGVIFDKLIVVAGGQGASSYDVSLQVFDTETNSWSTPQVTGTFTFRRAASSVVVNNKLYVFGGFNGSKAFNTLEMFDPENNTWSNPTTDNGNAKRYGGSATLLNNNIYLIGGFDFQFMVTDVEVFNTKTNEWDMENTTNDFTFRSGVVAAAVDNTIYVIGGATLQSVSATNEALKPIATSVHFDTQNTTVAVMPNPATEAIQCVGLPETATRATITNAIGMEVVNYTLSANGVIPVTDLASGVYYIQIPTSRGTIVRTFVKQ